MKDKPTRRTIIDPVVADLLSGMEDRASSRALTKHQRTEREKTRHRNRVMVDLPPEIESMIGAIAAGRDVSISGVVMIALAEFIRANDGGSVDWSAYLRPSRSPRFGFKVVLPGK